MQTEHDPSNHCANRIKRWLRILLIASPVLLPAGCGGYAFYQDQQKKRADALVDRLCSQDGGLTVYEQVMAPAHYFKSPEGAPHTPLENKTNSLKDIIVERNLAEVNIRAREPRVIRRESVFVRRTDNKIIARSIWYVRYGGLPFYIAWLAKYTDTYSCSARTINRDDTLYINFPQPKN